MVGVVAALPPVAYLVDSRSAVAAAVAVAIAALADLVPLARGSVAPAVERTQACSDAAVPYEAASADARPFSAGLETALVPVAEAGFGTPRAVEALLAYK